MAISIIEVCFSIDGAHIKFCIIVEQVMKIVKSILAIVLRILAFLVESFNIFVKGIRPLEIMYSFFKATISHL